MAIQWIRENPGAARDEGSYYVSADGRFAISPCFRHTVYPSGYALSDRTTTARHSADGIREAKGDAERILRREALAEQAAQDVGQIGS